MPRITVANQSGEMVRGMALTLDATTYHLGDIPPGESRAIRALVRHKTAIRVQGQTGAGAGIDATDGYMDAWILRGQRATVRIGAGGKVTIQ